ncbi:MAG: chemotaxis protein CheA [Paenibacillaceae bacterium]
MELDQYLSMFIEESKEHLQALNDNLMNLEQNPNDIAIVHNIFRSAHTLKGMSATMGYEDIASLTHQMENVLDLLRNLKLQMDSVIFDCLFKGTDALEAMVEDIVQGGTGRADVTAIVTNLKAIVAGDHLKQTTSTAAVAVAKETIPATLIDEFQFSVLDQALASGYQVFYVEVAVRDDCVLKAARAYMVFDVFERNGEVVKSTPSVQEIEQEKFEKVFSVYFISHVSQEIIEKNITNVSEIESVNVVPIDRESLKLVRRENINTGGTVKAPSSTQTDTNAAVHKEALVQQSSANVPVSNKTIRVDIERLDSLMNLFSELLIDRVRLEQLAGEILRNDLIETVEHISRVSSDLQNIVLKLRMVPVDTVFNRFPRMIRDIAKSLDKKVDLVITGADTELDRTVIDEIGDPLVHLLRNAVDHGVEPITDRIAAGKIETGTIHLRAFHSGNHVFIEIEEDGRGINREKVLKTAIKNGIVAADQASKMSDEDVYQLLFASGFSTADKISDISGRGVGLDVVKTKIHSLGGHVAIESKLGSGTKFSVQLPLTLSIISAMLLRVENEKYAIPLNSIVETAVIQNDKIRTIHGNSFIDFRNNVIPLVSLTKFFEIPHDPTAKSNETDIVVIKKGEKLAALIVNEFIGQQEIVLKTLGKYLSNIVAISGATILGDGQVALIIDTNALVK